MASSDVDLVLVSTPLKSDATHRGLCPSLSNLTIGSYLSRQGASVELHDPSVEIDTANLSASQVLDAEVARIVEIKPRFLGLSCLSPVEGKFGAVLARRVKAALPNLPVVMGGLWATTYATQILDQVAAVDAIVEGPGELAMESLLRASSQPTPQWSAASGVRWRGGHTPPSPRYEPSLARPLDLSLLARPEAYDIMVYLASRGCPYRCGFCSEPLMFPNYVDEPLDKVRADIAAFSALDKPYFFWICDPIFGFSPRRVQEMCELLAPTPFDFLLETRVDVMKPEMVEQVAAVGCKLIYFGLESGAYRTLVELGKCKDREHFERYLDGARALAEACAVHNIVPMFGVMNPVPGDRMADLQESLRFLEELVAISTKRNPELGLHLLPLRCRLDMGSPFQTGWPELAARGVTRACDEDALFDDMLVLRASDEVGEAEGEAFREQVRKLWTPTPAAMQVLSRCWPRPYLEMEWN